MLDCRIAGPFVIRNPQPRGFLLRCRGVNATRAHRIHPHIERRQIKRHALGHLQHRALRRVIGHELMLRYHAAHRRHVDNRALARLLQCRHRVLADQRRTKYVDSEHLEPIRHLRFFHAQLGEVRRIVDHNIQLLEALERGGGQRLGGLFARDVTGDQHSFAARFLDELQNAIAVLFVNVIQNQLCALLCKEYRRGLANTGTGSRHDGDFIL